MDFTIPDDIRRLLDELDEFIEDKIKPLEQSDDNIRFFDHRREDARTDWDRGGLPVAFVVFFLALTAYLGCALVAGGMLYGALNPVTIYTPMRVDPDTI